MVLFIYEANPLTPRPCISDLSNFVKKKKCKLECIRHIYLLFIKLLRQNLSLAWCRMYKLLKQLQYNLEIFQGIKKVS